MQSKKIAIMLPALKFGGMERVALIMDEMLKNNGYDVEIVVLSAKETDYEIRDNMVFLGSKIRANKIGKFLETIKRIVLIKNYKKRHKPNIVITLGKNVAFANAFSKQKNEKLYIGIRSYDFLENYMFGFILEKIMYSRADKVISVSNIIKNKFENIFNYDRSRSYTLYNPYDVEKINKLAEEEIVDDIFFDKEIKMISVGRLEDQKGYYHLIKAISLLDETLKNKMQLIIIGNGTRESLLKREINQLKLEKQVFLVGGRKNPYKYMKKADLYILSSITEGFPNALVEAMSLGIPVLSSDCKSGPREILTDGPIDGSTDNIEYCKYGIIYKALSDTKNYNPESIEDDDRLLANVLSEILLNKEKIKLYGRLGKKRVEKFSYERFEKKLLEIIEN